MGIAASRSSPNTGSLVAHHRRRHQGGPEEYSYQSLAFEPAAMGPYPMTASSCSRSVPNRRATRDGRGDLRSSAPPGICTHRRTHDDSPVSPDRAWRASLPKFREVAAVIWIVGCSGWRAERRYGAMFDAQALYRALEAQRAERGLTWPVSRRSCGNCLRS